MAVTAETQHERYSRPSVESVRKALTQVTASDLFARSPQQSKLLSYLCEQVLSGSSHELKEYTIAVEAMGLPEDYGQSEASTVRVAIHRLRKRLKTYYESEGINDSIEICLSAGEYTPQFHARQPQGDHSQGFEHPPDSAVEDTTSSVGDPGEAISTETAEYGKPAGPLNATDEPLASAQTQEAKPTARRRAGLIAAGAAAVLLLISYLYWHPRLQVAKPTPVGVVDHLKSMPAAGLIQGKPIRILAGAKGSEYTDASGNLWLNDRYFIGGEAHDTAAPVRSDKAPLIKRISDQSLVQHYRSGDDFSYEIPVQPGTYDLLLGFTETVFGPEKPAGGGENDRIFTVKINGSNAIDRLDVYSEAGGADILDTRRFADVVPSEDGKVHLQFNTESGNPAILSFIELVPQAASRVNPLRISTRERGLVDNMGQTWEADTYYLGGRSKVNSMKITGTPLPELYVGERFGNFSYNLPVPPGRRYRLTLYFAERYFGSDKIEDRGTGFGARVFDVSCNGAVLLRDFDILKEAGVKDRPIVKTFSGLTASPQGQLSISFIPSRNYALVNAIEVTEDTP